MTTIVKPSAFSWSSSSMSAAALRESRFPVGSSHSSRLGRLTSARAIATRWHSPPDSVVGSASSRWPSPTASSASTAAWSRVAPRRLVVQLGEQHVLQRRPVGQQVERLEDEPDPAAAQRGPVPVGQRGRVQAVQQVAALRSARRAGRAGAAASTCPSRTARSPRRSRPPRSPGRPGAAPAPAAARGRCGPGRAVRSRGSGSSAAHHHAGRRPPARPAVTGVTWT